MFLKGFVVKNRRLRIGRITLEEFPIRIKIECNSLCGSGEHETKHRRKQCAAPCEATRNIPKFHLFSFSRYWLPIGYQTTSKPIPDASRSVKHSPPFLP